MTTHRDIEPPGDTAIAACRMLLEALKTRDMGALLCARILALLAVNRTDGRPDDHGLDGVRI